MGVFTTKQEIENAYTKLRGTLQSIASKNNIEYLLHLNMTYNCYEGVFYGNNLNKEPLYFTVNISAIIKMPEEIVEEKFVDELKAYYNGVLR